MKAITFFKGMTEMVAFHSNFKESSDSIMNFGKRNISKKINCGIVIGYNFKFNGKI